MAQQTQIIVEATPRAERGKNEARRLRQTGKVPAVLYGGKGPAIKLAVNAQQVSAILQSASGHNTPVPVELSRQHETPILKELLTDTVTGKLPHLELLRA